MAKTKVVPAFSPRVQVILSHLEIVRDIETVVEKELDADLVKFMKDLPGFLRSRIDALDDWQDEFINREDALHLRPREGWDISGRRHVAVAIWTGEPTESDEQTSVAGVGFFRALFMEEASYVRKTSS